MFQSLEGRRESDVLNFCRVILPDQSSTIMTAKQGQTLRQALTQLCDRRQMSFVATDVFVAGTDRVRKYTHQFLFYLPLKS